MLTQFLAHSDPFKYPLFHSIIMTQSSVLISFLALALCLSSLLFFISPNSVFYLISLQKPKSPLLTVFLWYLTWSNGPLLSGTPRDELEFREAIPTQKAKRGMEKVNFYCAKLAARKEEFLSSLF